MGFKWTLSIPDSLKQNIYTIDFFKFVNSLENVSDDVKTILSAFTRERLAQFGKTFWTIERYKFVIKDLLVRCCNKQNFLEVTKYLFAFSNISFVLHSSFPFKYN